MNEFRVGWHVETWKEFGRFVWRGGGLPASPRTPRAFSTDNLSVVVLPNGDDADPASIGAARLRRDRRPGLEGMARVVQKLVSS